MKKITIDGRDYQTRKMDLFVSASVLRRFGNVAMVMTLMQTMIKDGVDRKQVLNETLPGLIMSSATLNDDSADYIRNACLDTIEVYLNGVWAPLRVGQRLVLDMDLLTLAKLVATVVEDTFFPFFAGLVSISPTEDLTGKDA